MTPLRTVIADDVAAIRLLLGMCLPEYGPFDIVAEAKDGMEAVTSVAAYRPDLLLLDLSMPVMDGLTAAAKIREFDQHVRIVVLSGFHYSVQGPAAFGAGVNDYLEKGVELEELAQRALALFPTGNGVRE